MNNKNMNIWVQSKLTAKNNTVTCQDTQSALHLALKKGLSRLTSGEEQGAAPQSPWTGTDSGKIKNWAQARVIKCVSENL